MQELIKVLVCSVKLENHTNVLIFSLNIRTVELMNFSLNALFFFSLEKTLVSYLKNLPGKFSCGDRIKSKQFSSTAIASNTECFHLPHACSDILHLENSMHSFL